MSEDRETVEKTIYYKIIIRCIIYAIVCIAIAITCLVTMGIKEMLWAIPALIALVPIGAGLRIIWLNKRGELTYTEVKCIDKKRDILGSLFKESSFTGKVKYTFKASEDTESFAVEKGGIRSDIEIGHIYLVMHRHNSPLGQGNFLEYAEIGIDESLSNNNNQETRKEKKK